MTPPGSDLRAPRSRAWSGVALAPPLLWLLVGAGCSPDPDAPGRGTASTSPSAVEEISAAAPGDPEVRLDPGETPDDDPAFDPEDPFAIDYVERGYPGFSEQELAGLPEPSIELDEIRLDAASHADLGLERVEKATEGEP